jgi:hypothetical protein
MDGRLRHFRVSTELKAVIAGLIDMLPERRPTAAKLLHYPFYERELQVRKAHGDWGSDSDSDHDEWSQAQ